VPEPVSLEAFIRIAEKIPLIPGNVPQPEIILVDTFAPVSHRIRD